MRWRLVDLMEKPLPLSTRSLNLLSMRKRISCILRQLGFSKSKKPITAGAGCRIRVFVPVGTLLSQRKRVARQSIVDGVHQWLKRNRLSLPDGDSEHLCPIAGIRGHPPLEITLSVKVVPMSGAGRLHIRRQQVEDNFGEVVDRALRKKLPKLAKAVADERIFLVERQHMILTPERILRQISKRSAMFPELAHVHKIWFVETMAYDTESLLYFEHFEHEKRVSSLAFCGAELLD